MYTISTIHQCQNWRSLLAAAHLWLGAWGRLVWEGEGSLRPTLRTLWCNTAAGLGMVLVCQQTIDYCYQNNNWQVVEDVFVTCYMLCVLCGVNYWWHWCPCLWMRNCSEWQTELVHLVNKNQEFYNSETRVKKCKKVDFFQEPKKFCYIFHLKILKVSYLNVLCIVYGK